MRLHIHGVHVPNRKNTAELAALRLPIPETVEIPMSMHIGAPAIPVVKPGDSVRVGQLIGKAGGFVSAPVYASVSGTVKKIGQQVGSGGRLMQTVVIAADGKQEPDPELQPPKLETMQDFLDAVRASGMVGLGGAGFPTVVKLTVKNLEQVQAVIINGAECEPYITSDTRTMLDRSDELMEGAVNYLQIYSLGMPAMAVYNFGNGVLSAAGDTKRPLLYLSIAGVVNVALNLFFVIQCHMAALGVATASAIAQWLSALLIMRHLMSQKDACGVHLKKLCIDKAAAKRVLMIGIPSGLQNAIFALANLFVQIGVNSFDSVMVSGSSAAANADTLIFNMMSAFYTGCATFVSRNWGAGKTDRILKSYRIVLLYSFLVGSICGGLLLLFGDKFLGLFANEADVIAAGMQRLKIMGFSFGVSALMDASIAASRGIGRSIVPTIIVIMGSCVFRVIWVYTVFTYFGTIPSLFLLYIFSWAITGIAEWAYFRHSYKKYILHGQIW